MAEAKPTAALASEISMRQSSSSNILNGSSINPITIEDYEDADTIHGTRKRPIEILGQDELDEESVQNRRMRKQKEHSDEFALHFQKGEEALLANDAQQLLRIQTDSAIATLLQQEEFLLARSSLRRLSKDDIFNSLETCQQQALKHVQSKAKQMHHQTLAALELRIVHKLGFLREELQQCLNYIRDDVPIAIHMTQYTLSKLVNDTHYRNIFETKIHKSWSYRWSREEWERKLFSSAYDEAKDFDRPKYGCLNVSGDVKGVNAAAMFGSLVITLQPHVRHRCTFFNTGAACFNDSDTLATNEYYAHVLHRYNDYELTAILNVCKTARMGGSSSTCATYKEVQIHGPICLATDVQSLSVPGKAKDAGSYLEEMVAAFQKKTQCNILWQDDIMNQS
jgi:hypothetical protein